MKQRIVTQLMTCMDESPRLLHSVDAIIRAIFNEEPVEEETLFNILFFAIQISYEDLSKGKECYDPLNLENKIFHYLFVFCFI
jgi:hypothetical protein